MPCFTPLNCWQAPHRRSDGKAIQSFNPQPGWKFLRLPCGQCIGCRLEHSRQWAIRIMHESQMHDDNCFITLTFNDENLPEDLSLEKRTMTLFWKRFRKKFPEHRIRYYYCGEYGEQLGRPHYHACVFGFDFDDKYLFHKTPGGDRLYRSPALESLWPYGYSSIGRLTFESAAYVARYVTKKVTGAKALYHYTDFDYHTGEIYKHRHPEFAEMSRRPGIGMEWFEQYGEEVYPHDRVIMRGKAMKPPRAYDKRLELTDPEVFANVKAARVENVVELTDAELEARLAVLRARMKLTKRPLK